MTKEEWFGLSPAERQQRAMGDLANRIRDMAMSVKDTPYERWPGWSTGEILMVAIVLNKVEALTAEGWTLAQAFDRVDLTPQQLRAIERAVFSS